MIHADEKCQNALSAASRRTMLKGAVAAGAVALSPFALLSRADADDGGDKHRHGDVAILRFLAAAELIEADLWEQYTELAFNNADYAAALSAIDDAIPQYSNDTTNDEVSHHQFINGYLRSIGADPVSLEPFRTLPAVQAPGADSGHMHLTNLRSVNVDTSWYLRYRGTGNPDFGATFPQIVTIVGQPTLPTSASLSEDQFKAAAYCAAFHFPMIEQGGTSLYSSLLRKVSGLETLEILAGIGSVEAIHFKIFEDTLEDLAGFTTPSGVSFPDLGSMRELAHEVMPKPCEFLSPHLPLCSVVRPSSNALAGARAALRAFENSNVFAGQSAAFFRFMRKLAEEADAAERDVRHG